MFNSELKKDALKRLERAKNNHMNALAVLERNAESLHDFRVNHSTPLIGEFTAYINTLANHPKEFDSTIIKYNKAFKRYESAVLKLVETSNHTDKVNKATIGAAVATRVIGLPALSTVAGVSLLGPLAIGGIIAGVFVASSKNKKIAEEAQDTTKEILKAVSKLKASNVELSEIHRITEKHTNGIKECFEILKSSAPNDYQNFNFEHKEILGSLINHINSLSILLKSNPT